MKYSLHLLFLVAALALFAKPLGAASVGPENGTLLVVGGGDKAGIWPVFFDLVGGKDAPIVVITTAHLKNDEENNDVRELRALGASHLTILHTDSRTEAQSEKFTEPLRAARAVWITGGRQWRLVDSYLDTRVQKEIEGVLARGGVVGGSSAGASIQASYLVRGAKSGNKILMAPGYEEGFGLLRETAIDQHVNTRGRAEDIQEVLKAHPRLLGIGLDESTALVVRQDRAEVIGAGFVRFIHREGSEWDSVDLASGAAFDLASRRPLEGSPASTTSVPADAVPAEKSPPLPGAIRVAVYSDEGSPNAPDLIENCLASLPGRFQVTRVSAKDIRGGTLGNFDVLAQGGGRASLQAEALGDAGREKIREFVRKGGGYVGICAGAYLAAADRPYYLRLANARVVDREHWARGGGDVQIRFTEEGRRDLVQDSPTVQIRYNQGPLLARDSQGDLPTYTELAVYETEIAKKGAPEGVMKGTSAMVSAPFGQGRVFLSSPHPERTPGLENILHAAFAWVARRDHPPKP